MADLESMSPDIYMAYMAGQAAKRDNLVEEVCPFEPGPERDAYLEGRRAEELEDVLRPDRLALQHTIDDGATGGRQ